jgi:uncharacterized protein (TIGR00255 family)
MMTSMTGFGSARFEDDHFLLNVQVKSVNGRFLESRFRMPREYSPLETELKKLLSQKFQRGTVDVNVNRVAKASSKPISVTVNMELAERWIDATKDMADKFNLPSNISLETLARVPEVVQFAEIDELQESEKALLFSAVNKAIDQCLVERQREGQDQVKTFTKLLDDLEKFVVDVKKKKDTIDKQLQVKLQERLNALKADTVIDPNRLAQEALFILEKADIAEEIERAMAHIAAFRKALKSPPPTGKKLEFYTQELHREVNTMGSKTQSLEVTLDIIDAKTIVERMREQVQNVE